MKICYIFKKILYMENVMHSEGEIKYNSLWSTPLWHRLLVGLSCLLMKQALRSLRFEGGSSRIIAALIDQTPCISAYGKHY